MITSLSCGRKYTLFHSNAMLRRPHETPSRLSASARRSNYPLAATEQRLFASYFATFNTRQTRRHLIVQLNRNVHGKCAMAHILEESNPSSRSLAKRREAQEGRRMKACMSISTFAEALSIAHPRGRRKSVILLPSSQAHDPGWPIAAIEYAWSQRIST